MITAIQIVIALVGGFVIFGLFTRTDNVDGAWIEAATEFHVQRLKAEQRCRRDGLPSPDWTVEERLACIEAKRIRLLRQRPKTG